MPVTATAAAARFAVRAEPNVAPMIDVMLVLLVIFMIVVPAMAAGTPAVPPRGTNLSPRPEVEDDQTLGIDREGHFYLNKRPVAPGNLRGQLRAIFGATGRADRVLYVTADRALDYGVVRDAVADASSAGVRVVGLVAEAQPPSSRPPR
jgi:biopolymer transport protein ExbD